MPTLKDKSIIVTGGAGFIGSHLVDRIIEEKPRRIVVLDNFFLGTRENLQPAANRFPGLVIEDCDVTDYQKTKKILTENEADVVFDLAVIPLPVSLEKPEWTFQHNVDMTVNLCRLGREKHYETLVHFSSSEVYGTARQTPMDENHYLGAITTYAASKAAGDQLVLSYHAMGYLDALVVRPFNNYGPRQNDKSYAGVIPLTINRILDDQPPILHGDGHQTRDYLYVTDTADATVRLYEEPKTRGQVVNIASGQEVTIRHIVQTIAQEMGNRQPIRHEPQRPGDVDRHLGDIKLAQELIGFQPTVDIDDGLQRTVDWYAQQREKIRA